MHNLLREPSMPCVVMFGDIGVQGEKNLGVTAEVRHYGFSAALNYHVSLPREDGVSALTTAVCMRCKLQYPTQSTNITDTRRWRKSAE